jgi:hypothetical protein
MVDPDETHRYTSRSFEKEVTVNLGSAAGRSSEQNILLPRPMNLDGISDSKK